MSRVHTHSAGLAVGARSEDLGRRRVELKVWRRTERGLQVGDLEVTEYIRIRSGPFEREDGASVHLAMTEARFMAD